MDGFLTTQLVYVAAKLGLRDVLSEGPQTAAEVAERVGAEPRSLARVMRGLAAEGVLVENGDGRFGLTEVGRALETLGGAAVVRGDLYYHSAAGLLDAVMDDGVAFERTYRAPFFDYLDHHPEAQTAFSDSMSGRSEQESADVTTAYDFSGVKSIVDVGGGQGTLLAEILRRTPTLRGLLVDRDPVLDTARARLDEAGVSARATCVAGDFFAELPAGGDGYLLSRVLHDWPDTDARRILAACRRAIPDHGRLIVVEAVLPDRAVDAPAAVRMDLHMMLLFGSRERTQAEFAALLQESGFHLQRVIMTRSPAGLAILEATPSPRHGHENEFM
jgi:ubiquinone/menaquinone biosynthesis C-methylase UbiE